MRPPIKVLFVVPSFQGGGAERVFIHLLRHIDRAKFTPLLAIGRMDGEFVGDVPDDVLRFELGSRRARGVVFPLARLTWKLKPDIVFPTLGMCVAAAIARFIMPRKICLIARLGNSVGPYLKDLARRGWMPMAAGYVANSLVYYNSNLVVAQSDYMLRDAIESLPISGVKLRRIYNPVDTDRITVLATEPGPLTVIGAPQLVAIGRLDWQKGFDDLLVAFAIVRSVYPAARLTILGEGKQRANLTLLAAKLRLEESVEIPGFCANPYRLIRSADVFVSSSRYEGFSNVILEALALGVPVVASNCPGGNREIIQPGRNGWIGPANDAAGFAEILISALREAAALDRNRIAQETRARFDVANICREFELLIEGSRR